MKMKTFAMLAAFASVVIGAFGAGAIHGQPQTQPRRPTFYISAFEVAHPEDIKPCSQQVHATFAPFGGGYVVRGGKTASLEREPPSVSR
jgi:hypothetical protein